MRRHVVLLLALTVAVSACGGDDAGSGPAGSPAAVPSFRQAPDKPAGPKAAAIAGSRSSFRTREVLGGFEVPVQVVTRAGDERLFVVEQAGLIRIVEDGRILPTPYLDITDRVRAGGELGLLTAVFSPDGTQLTAMWTDRRMDTHVTRYVAGQVRAERDASEELLRVDQPEDYENHKGGTLLHDADGRLLLGLGDGGSAFDPGNRAQDPATRLGKILRYDDERWSTVARGLRNPYRMSLDRNVLWIGDVGQDRVEEVDVVKLPEPGGPVLNFGWAAYEGTLPLGRKPLTGAPGGLVWPAVEYRHGSGRDQGCSVTGGLVHRGRKLPRLRGRYVFADFCTGRFRSLKADGSDLRRERAKPLAQVTSFAAAPGGGVLLTTADGRVHELMSD